MLVTLFFSFAPPRVDLTIKIIAIATPMNKNIIRKTFIISSGHSLHLKSPVLEYPTLQFAQRIPEYPSKQSPCGLFSGGLIPRHAG